MFVSRESTDPTSEDVRTVSQGLLTPLSHHCDSLVQLLCPYMDKECVQQHSSVGRGFTVRQQDLVVSWNQPEGNTWSRNCTVPLSLPVQIGFTAVLHSLSSLITLDVSLSPPALPAAFRWSGGEMVRGGSDGAAHVCPRSSAGASTAEFTVQRCPLLRRIHTHRNFLKPAIW